MTTHISVSALMAHLCLPRVARDFFIHRGKGQLFNLTCAVGCEGFPIVKLIPCICSSCTRVIKQLIFWSTLNCIFSFNFYDRYFSRRLYTLSIPKLSLSFSKLPEFGARTSLLAICNSDQIAYLP
ncbi:hypothetical protein TU75_18810 [Pseudomonas poae]|nr:hypothetical protein TU75_18810 [Pseudomonas poae]